MNEEISIKHDRKCCPDYDCLYTKWDKKKCRGCGADCSGCIWNKESAGVEADENS